MLGVGWGGVGWGVRRILTLILFIVYSKPLNPFRPQTLELLLPVHVNERLSHPLTPAADVSYILVDFSLKTLEKFVYSS